MVIPIFTIRQPWAWAYAAGAIGFHPIDASDDYAGPLAVVAVNTRVRLPTDREWLREVAGVENVPDSFAISALVGFVWSAGSCGRGDLPNDHVLDDSRRYYRVFVQPLLLAEPVVRRHWAADRGLPVDEAIRYASDTSGELAGRWAETFRALDRGESCEGLRYERRKRRSG